MNYYTELDNDRGVDELVEREFRMREKEEREAAIMDIKKTLQKLSDKQLIDFVLKRETKMNRPGMEFKLYDVCKRLSDNGWLPKGGQRGAIINTAAIAACDTKDVRSQTNVRRN